MNINIEADFEQAIRDIKSWQTKKIAEVKKTVASATTGVAGQADLLVPVDTTNLKLSQNIRFVNDGLGSEISYSAYYAYFVEFGTYKMRAQPFLFPSMEVMRPRYLQDMRKALST